MALLPFDTPSRWTLEAIHRADARAQDRGLFAYVASRAALGALGDGEFYRDQLRHDACGSTLRLLGSALAGRLSV